MLKPVNLLGGTCVQETNLSVYDAPFLRIYMHMLETMDNPMWPSILGVVYIIIAKGSYSRLGFVEGRHHSLSVLDIFDGRKRVD